LGTTAPALIRRTGWCLSNITAPDVDSFRLVTAVRDKQSQYPAFCLCSTFCAELCDVQQANKISVLEIL